MRTDYSTIYYPNTVIRDISLPAAARLLYGIILTDSIPTGYCRRTNCELGDSICLSQKRVSALVSTLVHRALITRDVIRDPKTGEVTERRLYPRMEEVARLRAYLAQKCNQVRS